MDRHARSPPPVFRRVWRENAPLSRLSRLSPSTAGHESRGGGPKTPLLLPSPPYCRAVLSRQSWPRNAISMGFFWGACAEAAIIPAANPLPPDPPLPYLAMGIQFSRSPSPWAATTFLEISLSRDESSSFIYIYSIDEEFVKKKREREGSVIDQRINLLFVLTTDFYSRSIGKGRKGGMWIREDGRSRPSLAGLDTGVFARYVTGQVDSPPPPPLSFYHVSLGNGARARACVEAAEGRCPLATSTTSFAYSRRRAPRKGWKGGRGTDTTANRPSPPSRPLVRGDRKEPTLLLPAPLLLSLSTLQAA